jgi:hypothetical protein
MGHFILFFYVRIFWSTWPIQAQCYFHHLCMACFSPYTLNVSISVDEPSCGTCSKYNSKRLSLDFFSANLAYKLTLECVFFFLSVFVSQALDFVRLKLRICDSCLAMAS